MKSLYNKIYKNYQVNMGNPFAINAPGIIPTSEHVGSVREKEELDSEYVETVDDILDRVNRETNQILQEAELEAKRIIEQSEIEANANAERILKDAWQTGYEQAQMEVSKQYEETMQEAEMIRDQSQKEYKSVMEGIETDAVELVLDIARKIIGIDLQFNPEDILLLIKQGIEKCSNRENIILKISPAEYHFVKSNEERLCAMLDGVGEITIRQDSNLASGACILETPFGTVDASVSMQFTKIEAAFRKLIGRI